jgi:DNA invertase Pin-like site-specific DNA recombinase
MNGNRFAILYLRLSDMRKEEALDGREARLQAKADQLGWTVVRVAIENDMSGGKPKPASAFKRRKIKVINPDGTEGSAYRVLRPVFQSVVEDLKKGSANALLAEDLDRIARDPRDLEDLIDVAEHYGAVVASATAGEINLTTGDGITMARVLCAFANKSSRDTARRVSSGRQRHAVNGSYGGGRRPFGYQPDPDSPSYAKSLLLVESEAAEIRQAASDVLHGVGLAPIAAGLRDRGVPTVTGARWTSETLRDVLVKPALAALVPSTDPDTGVTTFYPARWQPILDRETWQAVRDRLLDPARRTTPGNTPRWLLSGIAVCGVCGQSRDVHVTGVARNPSYVCSGHMKRAARPVEDLVERAIICRLGQPDVAGLLPPAGRPGTDTAVLRAEVRKLADRKKRLAVMFADGAIEADDLAAGMRQVRRRLDAAQAQLAAATEPDALAEFRDPMVDAAAVWESLSLGRRREIVKLLAKITMLPAGSGGGPRFNPDSVLIEWADGTAATTAAA